MTEKTTTVYRIQEHVSANVRWLNITYDIDNLIDAQKIKQNHQKNYPNHKFRIIRKEITETIVND